MSIQDFNNNISKLGLKPDHFNSKLYSKEQLIETISQSSFLYYTSLKHIILNKIKDYFQDQSIQLSDKVNNYIPRKNRRTHWINFSSSFDFKVPGLGLNNFAKIIILIFTITVIVLAFNLFTEILHLKLSGLYIGPILSGIIFLPISLIWMYGITKLPGKTISDLIDKIIAINTVDFLSNDKENFKSILEVELSKNKDH